MTTNFKADKAGTNQAITATSSTQITFPHEIYDNGNFFAGNTTWTPPAGLVELSGSYQTLNAVPESLGRLAFYKNGSFYRSARQTGIFTVSANIAFTQFTIIDQANGTDTYECYAFIIPNNSSIDGSSLVTWFAGRILTENDGPSAATAIMPSANTVIIQQNVRMIGY